MTSAVAVLSALALTLGLLAGSGLVTPAAAQPPSDDPRVVQSAGWLARQLEANDYTMPSSSGQPGSTDWGLTIDALFALAAAGVGRDVADQVVERLLTDGHAYTQSWAGNDLGSRAKMALALQIAGEDPTAFPTPDGDVDLIAQVRASIQPNGRLGASTNHFGQTLGLLALARTDEGIPEQAIQYVESLQCTDQGHRNYGGLGFDTGSNVCGNVDGDATGFMLSGLLAAGRTADDQSVQRGLAWMRETQAADGSFDPEWSPGLGNTNSTGLAGQVARQIGTPESIAVANRAASFIAGLQVGCGSPFAEGDDPDTGGGFITSWTGALAYTRAGYDDAAANGIRVNQTDQWRRASAQAIFGLGTAGFSEITITGMVPEVPAADPSCAEPDREPAVTILTVTGLTATSRYGVPASAVVTVAGSGASPTGSVRLSRAGTVLATGILSGGRATLWLPATLQVGNHALRVDYTPASAADHRAAHATVNHRVAKARTAVRKNWQRKPKPGRAGVLRVPVRTRDGSTRPDTGRVRVKIGKRIFRAKVSNGVAKVRVGRLAARRHQVKVRYQGGSTHAKSPVLKFRMRVRR